MKFYKLLDCINGGDVVKQDDMGKYYVYIYGKKSWQRSAIMVRYTWYEDTRYGEYAEITKAEAYEQINQQEDRLQRVLKMAEKTAKEVHGGQRDKGGFPYIDHLRSVADSVEGTEEKIVAWLHDVCEDSTLEPADLVQKGFPPKIICAVEVLTKSEEEIYVDYITRVKRNTLATKVKIADLKHNLDISRIKEPTRKDFERIEKYKRALGQLMK